MFRPLVMFSKSLVIDMLFRNRSGPLLTIDKHWFSENWKHEHWQCSKSNCFISRVML